MKTHDDVQRVVSAIVATIADMGAEGAPSGPIYAAVMAYGVSLDQYNKILFLLKSKKLIRESNYVLYYIGPKLEKEVLTH